jgi:hypothetical protein
LAFADQFPEFATMSPEQWPTALAIIQQQDPAKFSRIQTYVARSNQLFAAQQQIQRAQAETTQREFTGYAKSQDAKFDTMIPKVAPEQRRAIEGEIMAGVEEAGLQPDEFFARYNSEPLLRNAHFQKMMFDAAQYRLLQKAPAKAVSRPLPPVLRPGTAQSISRGAADVAALERQFSTAKGDRQTLPSDSATIRSVAKTKEDRRSPDPGLEDRTSPLKRLHSHLVIHSFEAVDMSNGYRWP